MALDILATLTLICIAVLLFKKDKIEITFNLNTPQAEEPTITQVDDSKNKDMEDLHAGIVESLNALMYGDDNDEGN